MASNMHIFGCSQPVRILHHQPQFLQLDLQTSTLLKAATIQLSHISCTQEEGSKQMFWKHQYRRQWPVMSRYIDPEKDVDWKACFSLRYQQEKEKRIAKKGTLQVTLNFFEHEEVSSSMRRIAAVQQQIEFETGMGKSRRRLMTSSDYNEAVVSEFSRWMDLFLEGTSFSDWGAFECDRPQFTRREGTWMLFLPTNLEGLTFSLEASQQLVSSGAAYDNLISLHIKERKSGKLLAKAVVGGDERSIDHKHLLHKLIDVDAALRRSVIEAVDDGEIWKAFPLAFMGYLCSCTDEFVEEERGIWYSKEELLDGSFNDP